MSSAKVKTPSADEMAKLKSLYDDVLSRLEEASTSISRSLGQKGGKLGASSVARELPLIDLQSIEKLSQLGAEAGQVPQNVNYDQGMCVVDERPNCIGVYDEKERMCRAQCPDFIYRPQIERPS